MGSGIAFKSLVTLFETPADRMAEEMKMLMGKYRETDDNLYPLIQLLCPELDKSGRVYNIQAKMLANLLVDALGISKTSPGAMKLDNFKSNAQHHGNFSDVVYSLLLDRKSFFPSEGKGKMTIADVNTFLDKLGASKEKRKEQLALMITIIYNFSPLEWKWMCRIILRQMHNGITEKSTLKALHPDALAFYNVHNNDMKLACKTLKSLSIRYKSEITVGTAFVPMCCERPHRLLTSDDVGDIFYIETKMDGERLQIHKNGDTYTLFSRNANNYTDLYRWIVDEIKNNKLIKAHQCILDAEICAWFPGNEVNASAT
jgi:DNA ligase-4